MSREAKGGEPKAGREMVPGEPKGGRPKAGGELMPGREIKGTVRILLVEDHLDQAELTRRIVERQLPGAEVTVADRGKACLARLAEATYDLLLLDYSLPDINGLEILGEVKKREYRLPVVMVTGQGDERIAVEAMKGGAADYLIKTGSHLTTLPSVIQKALHQAELQRNLAAAQAELLQRNRELTDLHTLAGTLSSSLHLADLLPLALEVILASMEAECGGVYLCPPGREDLILTVHRGLSPLALEHFPERVRAGEGLIGAAVLDGKAISLDDLSQGPLAESGMSRLIVAPLTAKGRRVGALFVGSPRAEACSLECQRLLDLIGNQVSVAVENARLYEEARNRGEQLAILHEAARALNAEPSLEVLLQRLVECARELVGARYAALGVLDEEGGIAQLLSAGLTQEERERIGPLSQGRGLMGVILRGGSPVRLDDIAAHRQSSGFPPHHPPMQNLLGVPILIGGKAMGALYLTEKASGFTPEDEELITALAADAAVAIKKTQLLDETRRQRREAVALQQRIVQAERLRALGEMAAGVAHDFNNLLAVILGRAQYLSLRQGEMPPEEVRRSLGIIERASFDGAETVRRLLEFTRAAPRPEEAIRVDVNELLSQTVEVSRHRWKDEAGAKGIRIQVALNPGEVPPVVGNPAELREALLNLVLNAIEAMPQGGTLTLSSWAEGGTLCLEVRDTGVGISPETRQQIFEPFFTTKGPQSSGLGLSAAHGIIRRHGGGIVVDSREGQGTTFTIKLPVQATPAATREDTRPARARKLRILVVDDQADVRETLRDILGAAGHEVWEAGSGPEGLEILERQCVDLVFTDLGMPGMTGWEVADRIKARWPGLKVALVTGWGVRVESNELKVHGVDFLIAKPFQVKEILCTLADLGQP